MKIDNTKKVIFHSLEQYQKAELYLHRKIWVIDKGISVYLKDMDFNSTLEHLAWVSASEMILFRNEWMSLFKDHLDYLIAQKQQQDYENNTQKTS